MASGFSHLLLHLLPLSAVVGDVSPVVPALVVALDGHLSLDLVLQLPHLADLGGLPDVVEVDLVALLEPHFEVSSYESCDGVGIVFPLLGSVALRDGRQLRVAVEQVGQGDGRPERNPHDGQIEMDVVLELVINPSGGSDGDRVPTVTDL